MTDDLVARLRKHAERIWPLALACSNLGKPESDNEVGREVMVMREAAAEIERLQAEVARLKDREASLIGACARKGIDIVEDCPPTVIAVWPESLDEPPVITKVKA